MDNYPPSVNELVETYSNSGIPRPLLVEEVRRAIDEGIWESLDERVETLRKLALQEVINATGVLLHTNLGRASWPTTFSGNPVNLELDLNSGSRGSRQGYLGRLFANLCETEAAMVVNNCSSAVLLILSALAHEKGVAISRGEMVEIGGGFRVPDVLELSGAYLVEVGTTNKTRREDYERSINAHRDVSMIMKIHQSNYKIVGFTESAEIRELAELGVPLVADIGSGLLDENCFWLESGPPNWLIGEPGARQTLAQGADIVTFSSDKLLGGPQAGIIAGKADLIEKCLDHPFARAVRPGSLVISSLQELCHKYLNRNWTDIPFWKMALTTKDELQRRAEQLKIGIPVPLNSVPGGGTLPSVEIPSFGIQIDHDISKELRDGTANNLPIIARVEDGKTLLDLRTIHPSLDDQVKSSLKQII
ncbi:L-seryl-tRNA(Sec) selenium transferase [bacterium]|nr:L-seryl-tRNA(Sec) selenium transferase [bacterium]|tara:strand:- start:182 stop:1441 length:1260 start_codon:yes stop_codon:yes gene_type:complete